jgi:hypothetical protein
MSAGARNGALAVKWEEFAMKTLMTLALAAGALLGVQAFTAAPAEAFGWGCGSRCCKAAVFYRPAACGCRRHYRPRRCCW